MVEYYQLASPGVTSISVDGVEHKVNPNHGFLEVHVATPGLEDAIAHHSGRLVDHQTVANKLSPEEAEERDRLFSEIDTMLGRRVDRRRSLQQLRETMADLKSAQATSAAGGPAAPNNASRPPADEAQTMDASGAGGKKKGS